MSAPAEAAPCSFCKRFFDFTCYVKNLCISQIVISAVLIVVALGLMILIAIVMIVSCIYCPGCYVKLACLPIKILRGIHKAMPKRDRRSRYLEESVESLN